MALRIPTPLNGWRAFFGEVGVIVLGVLIALGASQLVDAWQWRQQVQQADDLFRDEMDSATMNAYLQLATEPCLKSRLSEIAERLDEPGSNWIGMRETLNWKDVGSVPPKHPAPYSGSSGFAQITTSGWEIASATGTANHLPFSRSIMLSRAYSAARDLDEHQREERRAAAKLNALATDIVLDAEARTQFKKDANDVWRILDEIHRDSFGVLLNARQAGLGFTKSGIHEGMSGSTAYVLDLERKLRGPCVKKPELP